MVLSESQLVRATMVALNTRGFWVIRINSGQPLKRFRAAPAGTPDLHVIGLGWLEAKTEWGELRTAQKKWHTRARALGANVAVFRTTSEALKIAEEWRNNEIIKNRQSNISSS